MIVREGGFMQIAIHHAAVDLSGERILENVDMEINTNSRIAVVGRNGCGKTTLLRLISGELDNARPETEGASVAVSGSPTIGKLEQMSFKDNSVTVVDAVRSAYSEILEMKSRLDFYLEKMQSDDDEETIKEYTALLERFTNAGGFYFEKEYEAAIKRFGFTDEDKHRSVGELSGGQRTKIAFLRLLLSKPDLLLLDEPTNHLDVDAVTWLEEYLRDYKKAFVVVSHDRMFLDRTVNEVYEIEHGKTERYVGNYTEFTKQKKLLRAQQEKAYIAQQKEIQHLNEVADRFRYKATKAAMAQSKLKQIERMEKIDAPDSYDNRTFHATLEPSVKSAKQVLSVDNLQIGYTSVLSTVSFSLLRGERLGIIGGNGLGKSTLVKTLVGALPSMGGSFTLGAMVNVGYFDQQMAQYTSSLTVLDDYKNAFPRLNDFEARSALGAFLFSGEDVFKTVDMLSGGERVRLALCKLFAKKPNLLILDEPTNHMDILSKETLEDILSAYTGTIIFVSHDRYFVRKLAEKLLVFEDNTAQLYDCDYDKYEEIAAAKRQTAEQETAATPETRPAKKSFTTPAKEKRKRENAIKKAESKIAELETVIEEIKTKLQDPANAFDYVLLEQLQNDINAAEENLLEAMTEWESLQE